MSYIMLNDVTFHKEVLESRQPVFVEFFSPWSGLHHIMAQSLEEIAEKYGSRIKFCRIDAHMYKKLAEEYGIQDIPTVLLFRNGQVVDQIVDAIPRSAITQKLDALLQLVDSGY